MKYAYWGFGTVVAGLIGIIFIIMFQSITTNNETEYYVLKEAMEASMLESVDIACYRDANAEGCGEVIKISEQKFVENFTRRFTENISGDASSYELEFYDIIESPPKASVIVKGKTQSYSIMINEQDDDGSFDIINNLSGIIEYDPDYTENEGTIKVIKNESETDLTLRLETQDESLKIYSPNEESDESKCISDPASCEMDPSAAKEFDSRIEGELEAITEELKEYIKSEGLQAIIKDSDSSNLPSLETKKLTQENNSNGPKSITLNKTTKYLMYQNSFQLTTKLKNISSNITWTSSNSNIAKVDNNGKVTATGGGIATITATADGISVSCKVIAIRNTFSKQNAPWRSTATIYYDGNKTITYYFRRQNYDYACSSEVINKNQICTDGFRTWYGNHGCATISTTAVVNAYQGKNKNNGISTAKMRMVYEKNEYNWKTKLKNGKDAYCNQEGNLDQLTRDRIAAVLNNQFNLSATAYTIASTSGNETHIERITTALAEGRPVIFFVNAAQAGTDEFTKGTHTLTMVGFVNDKGHVMILDSSHNGINKYTVEQMVNKYIARGDGKYRGYIVLNNKK